MWSPDRLGNLRALRTLLMGLRRKLGEDGSNPRYIITEPRVGYRMPEGGGRVRWKSGNTGYSRSRLKAYNL
ncbi:MAG: winged helix-turn-helix domain-containing protein [Chloroflexi bacterium]|nr:winged helix-turn-helix domain-containing protein [Chloroflexota bacterium]MYE38967.1 winged helix-turn-helix domain-containing protein [Chloroflexota bacterium]